MNFNSHHFEIITSCSHYVFQVFYCIFFNCVNNISIFKNYIRIIIILNKNRTVNIFSCLYSIYLNVIFIFINISTAALHLNIIWDSTSTSTDTGYTK